MKGQDKTIFIGVAVLVLAGLFYFLAVSPKRERAAELEQEVSSLESSISQQESVAAFAEQARRDFPQYYGRLVVLGKAVPGEADTASLMVQLSDIASDSRVDFRGISLGTGSDGEGSASAAPAPAPAPAEGETATATAGDEGAATATTTDSGSSGTPDSAAAAVAAEDPAPATEATAATLPIGATVGPAGLPTLPYELNFTGGFFEIADYLGGRDAMVSSANSGRVSVDGRLLTVDGFAIKGGEPGSDPDLVANLMVTSYVTPAGEGLTAGATPGGPAPSPVAPSTTPASTVTP